MRPYFSSYFAFASACALIATTLVALAPGSAQAQIKPRLIADPIGRVGAERLQELIRRTQGLYGFQKSFEGVSETQLIKAGAAPSSLIKWGQIKNPVGEGFLTIKAITLNDKEKLGALEVWVPTVPMASCSAFLGEVFMIPDVTEIQVGDKMPRLPSGAQLSEKQFHEVCSYLEKDGARLVSPMVPLGSMQLREKRAPKMDPAKPLFAPQG